jgi:uncharacterized protein
MRLPDPEGRTKDKRLHLVASHFSRDRTAVSRRNEQLHSRFDPRVFSCVVSSGLMTKRLLLALFCVLSLSSVAIAESSVWKISKGKNSFYLGGTVHVLRASDFPLPSEFDTAYADSTKLLFEADVSRAQSAEMQNIIATRGMYTDGTTLDKVLTPEAWKAAQEFCAKAGIPEVGVKPLKPWLFAIMVSALELQKLGVSTEGVDMHFSKKAAKEGKSVAFLETFEEHIDYLVNMGAGQESEMIENTIKDIASLPKMVDGLLAAWKTGDLKEIDSIMLREMRGKYPKLFQELLVDRNNKWLPKLEALAKTPETEFVLVGVGHLAGAEGLVEQLRKRGYQVSQLTAQ